MVRPAGTLGYSEKGGTENRSEGICTARWTLWLIPVVPALKTQGRKTTWEFKATMGYTDLFQILKGLFFIIKAKDTTVSKYFLHRVLGSIPSITQK
ncbi:hypothetical protein I79_014228 [Cricetulus griseus]|uniref:Uncharacterized protein n=1 Tax=Cricetulus griseus TaxID=10029 RepID=G3HTK0_CRIGR|nr:hypothetical protein I79_014228 [Cricetulus griseus]